LQRSKADVGELEQVEAALRKDSADLLAELDRTREELRNVYGSPSWRVTEPLRRAKRALGR
jgi:hypothetical protein